MKDFVYQAANGKKYEFSEEEFKGFVDSLFKEYFEGRSNIISFLTEKVLEYHREPRQFEYETPRLMCDKDFKPFAYIYDIAILKDPYSKDNLYHVAVIYSRLGDQNCEKDPMLQFVHNGSVLHKSSLNSGCFFSKEDGYWSFNLGHIMIDTNDRMRAIRPYRGKQTYVAEDKQEEFELISSAMSRLARLKWKEQACEEYGSVKEAKKNWKRFSQWGVYDFPMYYIDELKEFDKELVELQKKHFNKDNVLKSNGKSYLKLDIEEEMEK